MIWLLVDLALALVAALVLVLLCRGLWRRLVVLKGDVQVLSGLAAQASDAVATIAR